MEERRDNITINRPPQDLEYQSAESEKNLGLGKIAGRHRDIIKEKIDSAHERIPGETDEHGAREVPKG
jgi:hypothetical protein